MIRILSYIIICVLLIACTSLLNTAATNIPPLLTETEPAAQITIPSLSFTPTNTATSTSEPTFTPIDTPTPVDNFVINQEDPYKIEFYGITYEDLVQMSDEEIISISPELDPLVYDLEPYTDGEMLVAAEILRLGEGGDNPYVLYKDSQGEVKMWIDLESGYAEHCEKSLFTDEQSGFQVNSYLVTDNSWREHGLWWGLDENGIAVLSREFFRHIMAFNNWFTNYFNEAYDRDGLNFESFYTVFYDSMSYERMTLEEVRQNQENALSMLRNDISYISPENPLQIGMGQRQTITLTEKKLDVIYQPVYSNIRQGGPEFWEDDYIYFATTYAYTENENKYEIDVNMNESLYLQDLPAYEKNRVGRFLFRVLRDRIPAFGISRINPDGRYHSNRSISDLFAFDACGEVKINNYLQSIGGNFFEEGIVPHEDNHNSNIPVCLITENR